MHVRAAAVCEDLPGYGTQQVPHEAERCRGQVCRYFVGRYCVDITLGFTHLPLTATTRARATTSGPPRTWPWRTTRGRWRRSSPRPSPGNSSSSSSCSSVSSCQEGKSSLTINVSVLLVSPFFSIIIVTELLYSYAEHIDQRAVPFVAT